jgi:ABC-type Fe3+/spermidine/putrescine transport system ATPase subunit
VRSDLSPARTSVVERLEQQPGVEPRVLLLDEPLPERDAWLKEQMRAESEVHAGSVAGCAWLASMRP